MTEYTLHFFLIQLTGDSKEIVDVGDFSTNFRFGTRRTNRVQPRKLGKDSDLTSGADGSDNVATADVTSKGTNGDGFVTNNKRLFFRNKSDDVEVLNENNY